MTRTLSRFGVFFTHPKSEAILLIVLTAMAAFLRLYKLGAWSYWEDEAFTMSAKEDGFNYSPFRQSFAITLIRWITSTLGANEFLARLGPALIGIITIPILFFLVRRLFGTLTGFLFAALLSVSTWHIYWSQNARFYSLLILFYTVAQLAFFWGLEEDKPWLFLVSFIFLGLAARERLTALFLIPIIAGYLFLLKILPFEKPAGFRLRNLAIFFLPGIVIGAFLIGPYVANLPKWFSDFSLVSNSPFWIFASVVFYIGIALACVAAAGAVLMLVRKSRAGLFFSLGSVIPLVSMMGLSLVQYSANRYVFVSLSSWILLASLTIKEALNGIKKEQSYFLGILLLVLASAHLTEDYLYYFYQNGNRADWKAAIQFIQEHSQDGDVVVSPNVDVARIYYPGRVIHMANFHLDPLDESQGRVWVIEDLTVRSRYPELFDWITENTQLMGVFDVSLRARLFKMRVHLYTPSDWKAVLYETRTVHRE